MRKILFILIFTFLSQLCPAPDMPIYFRSPTQSQSYSPTKGAWIDSNGALITTDTLKIGGVRLDATGGASKIGVNTSGLTNATTGTVQSVLAQLDAAITTATANVDASKITTGTLSTARYSAYSDLSAESKIGSGSTQVAAGNHTQAWSTITTTPTTIEGYGITNALSLGETSATAYRGDRGKTAYDHSQITTTPHVTETEKTTWNSKEPAITAGTTGQYWRGDKSWQTLDKTAVGLGSVENTALSTWTGTSNITTLGTVGTGTWNATAIADGKIATALTGKTYNALTLTALTTGFSIAGGTTSKTLTVPLDASVSGTNTGDQTLSGLGGVPTSRTITTTTPITIAGTTSADLSADRTIAMPAATNAVAGHATAAHITAIEANTAKVTNATHTGDVTGVTALTIANKQTMTATSPITISNSPTVISASGAPVIALGTVLFANGGTSATTAQVAINNLTAVSGATNEHVLTKDTATGNAIFKASIGGGAPTDATYITQTANGTLSAEQALSALSTGLMKVTTTTGVITSVTDNSSNWSTAYGWGNHASAGYLTSASIDTSAELASILGDETGTGAAVFATSPTLTTPILSGNVTYGTTRQLILAGTSDASDTGSFNICGGGAEGNTRGGEVIVYGNEFGANTRGTILLRPGQSGIGGTYDDSVAILAGSGKGLIPYEDSTNVLGNASFYWSNTYTDRLYLNSTAYLDGASAGVVAITGDVTAPNVTMATGGALRTGTTAGNTLLLQAYDSSIGSVYETFGTLTAGTVPTFNLSAAVTLGGSAIQTKLTNSAGLAAALSDETGSGATVFGTSPTFTTPILSGNMTYGTGTQTIVAGTSDASDTGGFQIAGGGAWGATRGGGIGVYGNEYATAAYTGMILLYPGQSGGAGAFSDYVVVAANTGKGLIPSADSINTLGNSSLYWSNAYTDRLYLNSTAYLDGASAGVAALTGGLTATTKITSSSPTAGIGYATGAGGAVTQATSKSTGVTLNTVCGTITMNNAALAAATIVTFTVTDSAVAATDVICAQHDSGGTIGSYLIVPNTSAAGSFKISVRNETAGSLSEAIVIRFVVIKAVIS